MKYFLEKGFTRIRAVDKKPLDEWYLRFPEVENLSLDCSNEESCKRVCDGAAEVYNLAADMGGMGFIEHFRVECLRSILINTHMIEAAYRAGARATSFLLPLARTTSCFSRIRMCVLSKNPMPILPWPSGVTAGKSSFREIFCQEYWAERGLKTFIARFHNVYGPHGTWDGGREKAPAAICRKVVEAIDNGSGQIEIWGDGNQTRSFMYIADCVKGIDMIMHCDELIATPINLGSAELVRSCCTTLYKPLR